MAGASAGSGLLPCPPCPACGAWLLAAGDRRTCPRCGGLYALELTAPIELGAYRGSTVIELVPVRESEGPPWVRSLRVHRTPGTALDVSIGRLPHDRSLVRPVAALVALAAIAIAILGAGPGSGWALCASLVPMAVLVEWLRPGEIEESTGDIAYDQLTVGGTRFVWRRSRGCEASVSRTVRLSQIAGIYDAGEEIRVELDDGQVWPLGRGLAIPPRVRRWVTRRLARLLPRR